MGGNSLRCQNAGVTPSRTFLRALRWALLAGFVLLTPLLAAAATAGEQAGDGGTAVINLTAASGIVPLQQGLLFGVDSQTAPNRNAPGNPEALDASIAWAPQTPGRVHAVGQQALWFRFDARTADDGMPWFLEVPVWGRGNISFYYRNTQGEWVAQQAGLDHAVSQWPVPGRYPSFRLSTQAGQTVRYWLRIEQDRTYFSTPMALLNLPNLTATHEQQQFWLGGYFGLVLFVLVMAIVRALTWRDRNFGFFALFVALIATAQLARMGIGAQHLWPEWLPWPTIAGTYLAPAAAAAALLLVRNLVEPARSSRRLDRLLLVLAAGLTALTVLDAARLPLPLPFANVLVAGAVLMTAILIAWLVLRAWLRGDNPGIGWIAVGFAPIVVMVSFPLSEIAGLGAANFLTRFGVSLGMAVSLPVLLYALGERSRRRRDAMVRARALASTDALTGLSNHHVLLVRLDAALQRARSQHLTCALIAVRLTNLDAIAADGKPGVAERALVLAAAQLHGIVSDIDLAARVGSSEFALLIESPATAGSVQQCATQIVARGLQPSPMLPAGTVLKFHVAAALLPGDPVDAAETLRWVLLAAQEMSINGKKAIRALNF